MQLVNNWDVNQVEFHFRTQGMFHPIMQSHGSLLHTYHILGFSYLWDWEQATESAQLEAWAPSEMWLLCQAPISNQLINLTFLISKRSPSSSSLLPHCHALISIPINFLPNYSCCLLTIPALLKFRWCIFNHGFKFSTPRPAGCGLDSLTSSCTAIPWDSLAQALCGFTPLNLHRHRSFREGVLAHFFFQLTPIHPSKHSFNFTSSRITLWCSCCFCVEQLSHVLFVTEDCISASTML